MSGEPARQAPNLREAFLPFTLRNAARLPFYARLWKGVDVEAISSTTGLSQLPTLSDEEYRRSFMFDASALSETEYITHTTGTTGTLTWRHRSTAEAAVIQELFGEGARRPSGALALVLRYSRHGMAMPVPSPTRGIPIDLGDDAELKQCVQMLTATYRFAEGSLRPTVIVGSGHDVALLAQASREAGIPADAVGIRALHLLGFVDTGLRRFLHAAFGGPEIIERYSLSEIFGGASRLSPSDAFTLDPYVIGEVVDEDGRPVPRGTVGELVLTELFPFVQMQPLIRYRTRDIVLLVDDDRDNFQFRWWGRRDDCISADIEGRRSWILGYAPVADALSLQPLVARQTHRSWLSSLTSTDVGPPCVVLGLEPDGTARVDVGLRINPWWAQEAVSGLADELWAGLRSLAGRCPPSVPVRLCFRHVLPPTADFRSAPGPAALTFLPAVLSSGTPPFPSPSPSA